MGAYYCMHTVCRQSWGCIWVAASFSSSTVPQGLLPTGKEFVFVLTFVRADKEHYQVSLLSLKGKEGKRVRDPSLTRKISFDLIEEQSTYNEVKWEQTPENKNILVNTFINLKASSSCSLSSYLAILTWFSLLCEIFYKLQIFPWLVWPQLLSINLFYSASIWYSLSIYW